MKINEKLQISKQGVNLVRTIVDNNNCFFHEIQQENDVGIDAIIELSYNNIMSGANFAVQIKTGSSYINYDRNECFFPIGKHRDYWTKHVLPVYGFVCDPVQKCFYYVNIKNYIENFGQEIENGSIKIIVFDIAIFNTITSENFNNLFKKLFLRHVPSFTFEDTQKLLSSSSINDIELGLRVLRKYHYSEEKTWEVFLEFFRDDEYPFFRNLILDYFSVGTHNPDSWHSGEGYVVSSKLANQNIKKFKREDIIQLLEMVDEEDGFRRGSIGEWVDFTIQIVPDNIKLLLGIINDRVLSLLARENALFLLACYDTKSFSNILANEDFSSYNTLKEHIQIYGSICPYM